MQLKKDKMNKSKEQLDKIQEFELLNVITKKSKTIEQLARKFKCSPATILLHLDSLRDFKYRIEEDENNEFFVNKLLPINYKHKFNINNWRGDELKFGFISDNHMCNIHERLDVMNTLYDIFAAEGITTVYNGGNWIDGEFRFNKNELHTHGLTKQIEYAVRHYPYRKGITTHFIAGDDHEGWYVQREGIDIGEYFQMKREQSGLFDLKYLGYSEADIELTEDGFKNKSWLRILHPGGGSAYALSYAPQKIVESYQGGEKPSVLLIGHFHKLGYEYPREVHCIQMGCTEDQSLFMRKKRIQAMVGGGINTLRRAYDGTINRCLPDFITFFDKGFYIGKDKYFKK
jgi:hypothetical protein